MQHPLQHSVAAGSLISEGEVLLLQSTTGFMPEYSEKDIAKNVRTGY